MPKTMTFDRYQLEIVRKLLRTELKRAQTRVEREQANATGISGMGPLEKATKHRDLVAGLLQEAQLPVMVERTNLMTGGKFMEPEDTPNYCSPASEAYWSM